MTRIRETTKVQERLTASGQIRRMTLNVNLPPASALHQLGEADCELLQRCTSQMCECMHDRRFASAAFERLTPATVVKIAETGDPAGPPLSRECERLLFLRFNYCRHRVMCILRENQGRTLSIADCRRLIAWRRASECLRNRLVDRNIGLVKAMAGRFAHQNVELSELVCEGNLALLRCVDKFDAARGYRFSTYVCRAILAAFARYAARQTRDRARAPVRYEPDLDAADHLECRREETARDMVQELRLIITDNAARLTNMEQRVLIARFSPRTLNGRGDGRDRWTLQQTGIWLGVSKERVRQIQIRAISKLRTVLYRRLASA